MPLIAVHAPKILARIEHRLIAEGLLLPDAQGRLLSRASNDPLPVLGIVEAGFPSPAEEELLDTMSLDDFLLGERKEARYLLHVKGDSMIGACICDGDLVIVERTNSPRVGDIVIAEVDGEWTMKYLRQRGERFYLEAANPAYKPIVPKEALKVVAVVTAVIRKYVRLP